MSDQTKSTSIFRCKKCLKLPFTYLSNQNEIIIECLSCKLIEKISIKSIEDYSNLISKKSLPPCDSHNSDSVEFCMTCNKCLCSKCLEGHNFLFKDHEIKNSYINMETKCKIHNNIIDRFCKYCHKELCIQCESEKEHNAHFNNIILLDSLYNQDKLQEIQDNFNKAKDIILVNNEKIKNELLKDIDNEIERIDKEYKKKIKKAESESVSKIEEYNTEIENLKKSIIDENENIKQTIEDLTNTSKKINTNLNNKKIKIEEIYKKNYEINKELIHYFQVVNDNFKDYNGKLNYSGIQSLLYNSNFNFKTMDNYFSFNNIEDEKEIEENRKINIDIINKYSKVFNYFSNYLIIESPNSSNINIPLLKFNENNQENKEGNVQENKEGNVQENKEENVQENKEEIKDNDEAIDEFFKKNSLLNSLIEKSLMEDNKLELIFCEKCCRIPQITFLNKEEIKVVCPSCKTIKTENLKSFLLSFSDKIKSVKKGDYYLSGCCNNKVHGQRESVKQCLLCEKAFCNECLKYHNLANNDHPLIENFMNVHIKCSNHANFIIGYCINCNCDICDKCYIIDKHNEHTDKVFLFEDSIKKLDDIKASFDKAKKDALENSINEKNNYIDEINKEINEINENSNKKIAQYKKETSELIESYRKEIQKFNLLIQKALESQKVSIDDEMISTKKLVNKKNEYINKIEYNYIENKNYNKNLIKIFEIFLSNYNYYNGKNIYNSLLNIISNSKFDFKNFEEYLKYNNFKINSNIEGQSKEDILISYYKNKFLIDFDAYKIKLKDLRPVKKINLKIMQMLILNDNRLVLCIIDNSLVVFNHQISIIDVKIKGLHKDGNTLFSSISRINSISNLDKTSNRIITCSNKEIKITEILQKSYKILATISNENSTQLFKVLNLRNGLFASCGLNEKISIYDSEKFKLIDSLPSEGNDFTIFELKNYDILISANQKDDVVTFWDTKKWEMAEIFKNIFVASKNSIYETVDKKILFGGNGTISIVGINESIDGGIKFVIEGIINNEKLGTILCFCCLNDGFIICGNKKGKIVKINEKFNYDEEYVFGSNDISWILNYDENNVAFELDDHVSINGQEAK